MADVPSVLPTAVGMSLWDEVKRTIYEEYWRECNRLVTKIDSQIIETRGERDVENDKNTEAFKALVLAFYRACSKKWLHFQPPGWEQSEGFRALKELRLERFRDEPHEFKLADARLVFDCLTEFIECDGVTHFERKSLDGAHAAIEDLD